MTVKRPAKPGPSRQGVIVIASALVMTLAMGVGATVSTGRDSEVADELDRLWPVEVPESMGGTPAMEVTLGDSTMALSEGEVADRKHGCRHEHQSWPELIGAVNLSCSGAGARTVTGLAREADELSPETTRVYITVGTNSLRYGMNASQTHEAMVELVEVVERRAPAAEVVFVGYLTVKADPECMSERDQRVARQVDRLHIEADEIMEEVAEEVGAQWIPVDGADYPACDPGRAYIHDGAPDRGTPWHSTAAGHRYVADHVTEETNP